MHSMCKVSISISNFYQIVFGFNCLNSGEVFTEKLEYMSVVLNHLNWIIGISRRSLLWRKTETICPKNFMKNIYLFITEDRIPTIPSKTFPSTFNYLQMLLQFSNLIFYMISFNMF